MIKRELYLKEIRPLIGKDIIKVLTGIRRCGKSTLLKQIKEELIQMGISEENILEINFDSMQFQDIVDKDDLNENVSNFIKNPDEKYYLFFDEIQNVNGWERSLSGFIVDFNVDIYEGLMQNCCQENLQHTSQDDTWHLTFIPSHLKK